jgi:hypothetical protein
MMKSDYTEAAVRKSNHFETMNMDYGTGAMSIGLEQLLQGTLK